MNPSLIEMINFCNDKGYDVLPIREQLLTKFVITKDDKFLKTGKKLFKKWQDGQKEVFTKLYETLKK